MMVAIAFLPGRDGRLRAIAPDLANCDLAGATDQELLPKLRLAIEWELTRLLLAGAPLPDTRDGQPLPGFRPPEGTPASVRWLHVHINLAHLEALARHQRGR